MDGPVQENCQKQDVEKGCSFHSGVSAFSGGIGGRLSPSLPFKSWLIWMVEGEGAASFGLSFSFSTSVGVGAFSSGKGGGSDAFSGSSASV